jgi:hypothetical protein
MRQVRLDVMPTIVGVVSGHDGKNVVHVKVLLLFGLFFLRVEDELVLGLLWKVGYFGE